MKKIKQKVKNKVNNTVNKALYNLFGIVQPNPDQSFLTPRGIKYTIVPNNIEFSEWSKGEYSKYIHTAS